MIFLVGFRQNSNIFVQPEVRVLTGSKWIESWNESWSTVIEQLFFEFRVTQMSVSGLNLKSLADRGFSMMIGLDIRYSDWSIVSGNTLIGWLN